MLGKSIWDVGRLMIELGSMGSMVDRFDSSSGERVDLCLFL